MAVEWQEVFSTNVSQIGHDPDTDELHVTWANGKTSIYAGVSAQKASQVMRAPSVGSAIASTIKPNHQHRYA